MNREVRGGGRTGLSGQLLGLEAWNLAQREEKQKERWRLGEKAGGRRTDERNGGAKEGVEPLVLGGVFAVPSCQMDRKRSSARWPPELES